MAPVKNAFDRFRKPEYTGENRCLPCTAINVFAALLLAISIALVWPPGGAFVMIACLLVIALRGYLVPGTPTLTARYLPETVLRWFGKAEPTERFAAETSSDERVRDGKSDVEELLLSAGVVEVDPGTDDLQLTERFHDAWWRRIRRLRDDGGELERLAAILDVDVDALSIDVEGGNDRLVVSFEEDAIAHWVSEAAFYADLAVEPTLREWLPRWDELTDDRRTSLIAGLRAFLEECPRCEAPLEPVENVRKSCCSSDFVRVTVECEACDSRVFDGSYR